MSVKLSKSTRNIIPVLTMQDGELAQIVDWSFPLYIGRVVQRCGEHLITIGEGHGSSWPSLFVRGYLDPNHKVQILKAGEIIVVE